MGSERTGVGGAVALLFDICLGLTAYLVKDTEGLSYLLLTVCILHLSGHHGQELWEVNGPITISIHLINHVLQFRLSGVLPQRSHHSPQLLGGNGAISILVEEGEGFLELWERKGMCRSQASGRAPTLRHTPCPLSLSTRSMRNCPSPQPL